MFEKVKNYTLVRPRLKKTVGGTFVFVGFLGLLMPLIPGAIFLVIGLELLGLQFLFFDKIFGRKPKVTAEVVG